MMRFTRIAGGLILAGLLAVAAATWVDLAVGAGDPFAANPGKANPDKAKQGKAKKEPAAPPPAMASQGYFGDDIEKINTTCELKPSQKTTLERMKAELDKALEKHDRESATRLAIIESNSAKFGPNRKVPQAPQAPDARGQIEAMKAQMAAERENLSQSYTRRMFAVLTADQKAKWNTPLLNEAMTKEFSVVMLEPKQTEKLDAFCAQQAKVMTFPVDPFTPDDKQLNSIKLQIYKTILTTAQQTEYRQIKSPAKQPVKGAKGAKGAGKL